MRNLLRGLMDDRHPPDAEPGRGGRLEVRHRVLIDREPGLVWRELVAPEQAPAAQQDVAVVRVPLGDTGSASGLATLWRRPNGRLRAGLAEVVSVQEPGLVVTRSLHRLDGPVLTTTCAAMDDRCLVEQRLEGCVAAHAREPLAAFALAWMQRSLIGFKERLEAEGRTAGEPDLPGRHTHEPALAAELAAIDETAVVGGLVRVDHDEVVEVAVPPEELWALLTDPGLEHLLRPRTSKAARVAMTGMGSDVLVVAHGDGDGEWSVEASHVMLTAPSRIVERSLTSEFELSVVTQVLPSASGSRLTESLVGSVPAGAGAVSGAGPAAELLRTRLAVVKHFAEAGVRPARDPRTGFLPPGCDPPPEPAAPPVPPAVLLPPPHLPVPVPVHHPRRPSGVDYLQSFELPFGLPFGL